MLVLNCSMKLQMLEKMLQRSFPESLKVYGAVMNINRGNPFRKEVVVDSWPDFKAVITRLQRENEMDDLDHYTNAHAVFYKELQAYQELLENTNAINWGQIFQIQGLQHGICEISRRVALSKQVDVKTSTFQMVIHSDPDTLPDVRLQMDPKLTLANLDISHASLISKTWSRGDNPRSQKYLANLIRCFPSVCVLDDNGTNGFCLLLKCVDLTWRVYRLCDIVHPPDLANVKQYCAITHEHSGIDIFETTSTFF